MVKMKKNKKCLVKGTYSHPQVNGYLTVKQFMIVEQDQKKCLLLRFVNEASFNISSAEFLLKQLNSKGEVIDSSKVKCPKLNARAGTMCALDNAIVLKKDCVDVIVQMISVVGGKYQYRFNNGTVTAHYDKRGYSYGTYEAQRVNRKSSYVETAQKYSGGGRFHKGIAFLSFILVLVSFVAVVIWINRPEPEEKIQIDDLTDKSTAISTEILPEFSTETSTEGSTEVSTETSTEVSTEVSTEAATEKST